MIIVRVTSLPFRVKGVTVPDEDGNYNVYINQRLNFETQKRTYFHEVEHINKNDFTSHDSVRHIEERTRTKVSTMIKREA